MKKIDFDDDDIVSMLMVGVGAYDELNKNGTNGKHPDLIHLMASGILSALAAAATFFDTKNSDDVELMRGLLALFAGSQVVEKIIDLTSENIDENVSSQIFEKVDGFIHDSFHAVEGSENGCKPS